MTNAEVIQTMTVKELARFLIMFCNDSKEEVEHFLEGGYDEDIAKWLRQGCYGTDGLLTENATRYWRVH